MTNVLPHFKRYWNEFISLKEPIMNKSCVILSMLSFFCLAQVNGVAAQDDIAPVWNDDGSYIYFYSYRGKTPETAYDVPAQSYRMKADGSDQTQITDSAHRNWWVLPFHHGRLIVVSDREALEPFGGANIYPHNPRDESYEPIADIDPKKGRWALHMSKSDDNASLLYLVPESSFRDKKAELFKYDFSKKESVQLLKEFDLISSPFLSGNGKKIAFVSNHKIYTSDENGHNVREVLAMKREEKSSFYGLSVSSDGKRLAFSFAKDGIKSAELYTVNADGTHLQQLTDNSFRDTNPNWSPDNMKIAFNSVRNNSLNHNDVYVIAANGGIETNLTKTSIVDEE